MSGVELASDVNGGDAARAEHGLELIALDADQREDLVRVETRRELAVVAIAVDLGWRMPVSRQKLRQQRRTYGSSTGRSDMQSPDAAGALFKSDANQTHTA